MPSITVPRRIVIFVPLALLVMLTGWAVWEFQPRRQLEKVFARFVDAGERRDWKSASAFLAPDYRDAWGFQRDQAIATASEWLGTFLVLEISTAPETVILSDRTARISTRPRLSGSGSAIAQMVMNHVNSLEGEMTFIWRRESWKPWDWRLVAVEHPSADGATF